jgi:ABC-type antimicrobial peptide transport system permease subunit
MSQIRANSVAAQTFAMRLLIGFAFVASVLAMVGIYGVLSLSTHSRKREIAIRIAVGAQRRSVLGLVLADGLKLMAFGLVAGVCLAMALARALRVFLFGVGPTDLTTFVSVAAVFTAVAMLACYFPARRATRTDPMTVLRYD